MPISVHFPPPGLHPAKYDDAIRRLEESGRSEPAGRLSHVALDAEGEIEVFDI